MGFILAGTVQTMIAGQSTLTLSVGKAFLVPPCTPQRTGHRPGRWPDAVHLHRRGGHDPARAVDASRPPPFGSAVQPRSAPRTAAWFGMIGALVLWRCRPGSIMVPVTAASVVRVSVIGRGRRWREYAAGFGCCAVIARQGPGVLSGFIPAVLAGRPGPGCARCCAPRVTGTVPEQW